MFSWVGRRGKGGLRAGGKLDEGWRRWKEGRS